MNIKDKIRTLISFIVSLRYFGAIASLLFLFVVLFIVASIVALINYVTSPNTPIKWIDILAISVFGSFVLSAFINGVSVISASFSRISRSIAIRQLQSGINIEKNSKLYLNYKRSLTIKDFYTTIIPLLESIEKINIQVGIAKNWQIDNTLYIKQLHFSSPLEIFLGGFIPETIETLRQLFKDKQFRNEHERKLAELTLAKTDLELTQKRIEIQSMILDNTKKLIDIALPHATNKQRSALAVSLLPEIQLIMEKDREISMTQSLQSSNKANKGK